MLNSLAVSAMAIALVLVTGIRSYAQDIEGAFESFYSTCIAYGSDYDRVKATAKAFGWRPVPSDMLSVIAPSQPVDAFEGWMASGAGFPAQALVGISKTKIDGRPIQTCVLGLMDVDAAAFEQEFIKRLSPKPVAKSDDGMQVFKAFKIKAGIGRIDQLITINTASPSKKLKGIIIGSIVEKK